MKLRTKFQDEDFELGEVTDVDIATTPDGRIKAQAEAMRGGLHTIFYKTKAEFDADWEDVPKKEVWYLGKRIGNYSMPIKEANIVTEKILAWKRLKDKGFKFEGYDIHYNHWHINFTFDNYCTGEPHSASDDLDLLFGGGDG